MKYKSKIENFFINRTSQIEKRYVFNEMVQSFVTLIPVFVIGALVLVLQNFPVKAVSDFVANAFGGLLNEVLGYVYDATYGMVAVYILIVLSFRYSIALTKGFSNINVLNTITSVAAYFILISGDVLTSSADMDVKAFLIDYTSARNVFMATVVAIISTKITLKVNDLIRNKYAAVHLHTDFSHSAKGIIPVGVTLTLFFVFVMLVKGITGYDRVGDLVVAIINKPFSLLGQTVLSGALLIFVENIVWFFGLHGANMFTDLTELIFPEGSGEIFTKTFYDVYTTISGSGLTIGLVITSLFLFKDRESKKIMGVSLVSGIFNINEIVVFGLPIVLNLPLIIPFVLVPIVAFLIAYGATSLGLVPMVTTTVQWTTPPVISGYMATGSWKGAALQIVIIAISIIIYYPFVKLYVKIRKSLYETNIKQLADMYKMSSENNEKFKFSHLQDNLIRVATNLGEELKCDVNEGNISVYYQPQHDSTKRVVSSEALLRWKADTDKFIYAPLIVAISKEFKVYSQLTMQIIDKVLSDAVRTYEEIGTYLPVSVNIDVELLGNDEFVEWVIESVRMYGIPDGTLGLEITEQENLLKVTNLSEILENFRKNGIIVSIDDFSMGYTSLAYLQMNQFDYIKLDGGIVKNMEKNERSKDIVNSLIQLGDNLGFEVVAEYVENKNLESILDELGCHKYQGYLYSPAVPIDKYIEYIKQKRTDGHKVEQ